MKHITPFGIFATVMVTITITFIVIVWRSSNKTINMPDLTNVTNTITSGVSGITSGWNRSNLYELTDQAVHEVCMSTSILPLPPQKYTDDGNYHIIPIGRMVAVKIIGKHHSTKDYESLLKGLKRHYKNRYGVRSIYINNGGTITIDCRY